MELHVSLGGRKDLTGEIYRQVRAAIVAGRLRPGDSLPATRELAHRLGVSRTTVTVAYDRLSGEGLVRCRVGAGTFVSDEVPDPVSLPSRAAGALRPRPVWRPITAPTGCLGRADYDFRTGLPDMTLFPYAAWRRLMAGELCATAVGRGDHGDPAGLPALREAIVRHVGTSRGVMVASENVVITNGMQQALDLVARVLLGPGDRVAVEDPGYPPPRHLFGSLGLDVVGVPVDDEGLVVDELPEGTRLVYVTPAHQFPLGVSMSARRRTALLRWAEHHDAAIVEDDYDTDFRYGGRPIEPLHAIDTDTRVVYVGSFSKTMLPSLRLGFVVAPASLSPALRSAKYVTDSSTALPSQSALAHFIDQGLLAGHLHRMRAVYERRHELVTALVDGDLADHLTRIPSAAGLHVSAIAPAHSARTMATVVAEARRAGVALQPLDGFCVDRPARVGLVLGFGAIETDRIAEGLGRLRRALDRAAHG